MDLTETIRLFVGITIWVLAIYLVIKLIVKLVRGDLKRSNKELNRKTKELEADYRWRRLKVAYIALSTIIVLFATGTAYSSTVHQTLWGTYTEPSMERGYVALALGSFVSWVVYKVALWRLYTYLVSPKSD